MRRVCVFCGSSSGRRPAYADAARRLGRTLVARDLELVYGGGCVGLMGVMADTVLDAGGVVIGVIPEHLRGREIDHPGVTDLRVVDTMHERKATMFDLSDAFIALPGGFGTLEELTEIVTWLQLGLHAKPVGLLEVDGYFDELSAFLDHAVGEGFIDPAYRRLVLSASSGEDLLEAFERFSPPPTERRLSPDRR